MPQVLRLLLHPSKSLKCLLHLLKIGVTTVPASLPCPAVTLGLQRAGGRGGREGAIQTPCPGSRPSLPSSKKAEMLPVDVTCWNEPIACSGRCCEAHEASPASAERLSPPPPHLGACRSRSPCDSERVQLRRDPAGTEQAAGTLREPNGFGSSSA